MNPNDEPQQNMMPGGNPSPQQPIGSQIGPSPSNPFQTQVGQGGQNIYFEWDSLGGLVVKNGAGEAVLKMNQNAFITAFTKAFAASSNRSGVFGDDWFQFFCEQDSIDTKSVGVIELPNSNGMLIKRSGGGAIIRIRSVAGGAGYIDLFEPLIFRSLSSDPAYASSQLGMMYYNTTLGKMKVFVGVTTGAVATISFANTNPDTINRSAGSFVTDGFKSGMTITVSGSVSNNGTYTIATVVAGTLTLIPSDSLATEAAGASVTIAGNAWHTISSS
jgi:hypothetical protein